MRLPTTARKHLTQASPAGPRTITISHELFFFGGGGHANPATSSTGPELEWQQLFEIVVVQCPGKFSFGDGR